MSAEEVVWLCAGGVLGAFYFDELFAFGRWLGRRIGMLILGD